jgi:hypothetical protein
MAVRALGTHPDTSEQHLKNATSQLNVEISIIYALFIPEANAQPIPTLPNVHNNPDQ